MIVAVPGNDELKPTEQLELVVPATSAQVPLGIRVPRVVVRLTVPVGSGEVDPDTVTLQVLKPFTDIELGTQETTVLEKDWMTKVPKLGELSESPE